MEFNVGEAYDLNGSEELKKKKNTKRFIILVIIAVVVLFGIIAAIIFWASYTEAHKIKELEEDEAEIIAPGNYYHDIYGKVATFQQTYLLNRDKLLEISNNEISDDSDYIRNISIEICEDGTYQELLTEYYNGEHYDSLVVGTMDVTELKEYLHNNEEIFKGFYTNYEDEREEEGAEGKAFVVHWGNQFSIVDELRYQKQVYGLYLSADKEIIQTYEMTDGE